MSSFHQILKNKLIIYQLILDARFLKQNTPLTYIQFSYNQKVICSRCKRIIYPIGHFFLCLPRIRKKQDIFSVERRGPHNATHPIHAMEDCWVSAGHSKLASWKFSSPYKCAHVFRGEYFNRWARATSHIVCLVCRVTLWFIKWCIISSSYKFWWNQLISHVYTNY